MSRTVLNSGVYRTGEAAIETMPRITLPTARYGAIFAHPAGGNASTAQITPYAQFIEALAAAGYPVHASDLCASTYKSAVGSLTGLWGTQCYNFGNADHVSAIDAAFTRLVAIGAKAGKFYGVGSSMGCLGLLNYAKANPAKVAGLALFVPPLDLVDAYLKLYAFAGNATTYQGPFATAFGLSAPVTHSGATWTTSAASISDASATSAVNGWYVCAPGIPVGTTVLSVSGGVVTLSATPTAPGTSASVSYLAPLSAGQIAAGSAVAYGAGALAGIPIQIFSSDTDNVAATTPVCQQWAAGQPNIQVASMGSIGHSVPAGFDPQKIVQFFDSNGGRS